MTRIVAAVVLLACQVQEGQETPPVGREDLRATGHWDLELLPERVIYAPYLAAPRQSRTGTQLQFPLNDSHVKVETILGTYKPLALWTNPLNPDEEAEFFIEAAAFTRFDIHEQYDMDAADFRFGFPFAYRMHDVTAKLHVYHLTSHLGDEFIDRTGRDRAIYHLEEAALGLSWQVAPNYRLYGEIGWAVYNGSDTGSGRAQVGGEWIGNAWKGWVNPYLAVDLETRNEIDWDLNSTAATGLILSGKSGKNILTFRLEYYRGHDRQTQFKEDREHFWSLGASTNF